MRRELVLAGGLVDVHVHFRDPGAPEAETRRSGAAAAAAGGFSRVVTMPNTRPAGDDPAWVREQIEDRALPVRIHPAACITRGRLGREVADLEALAAAGAVLFTDDGDFVADESVMRAAMRRAAALGLPVSQHAVVPALRDDPSFRPPHVGMMAVRAETEAVRRDIRLCRDTGCRLHVQHIAFGETVSLIREARREGLPVTGEATPHHLYLSADMIPPSADANWKMAPPLATRDDVSELRRAVMEGLLFFATDHAPHPAARKCVPWAAAANGIVGLETAAAVTYQALVVEEGMPEADWLARWTTDPLRFLFPHGAPPTDLPGADPVLVIDPDRPTVVDPATFRSRSRNTPFAGMSFAARVEAKR